MPSPRNSADEIIDAKALLDLRRSHRARAELEASVRALARHVETLDAQLEHVLALAAYDARPVMIETRQKKGALDELVAVAAASDWHIEERVRPETVNGANEYTPEIAGDRARRYFERVLRLIALNRAGARIDRLVLWIGGDIITGYIHEELVEDNWLSPTEASLLAFDLFTGGIDFLLAKGDLKEIVVACNYGNHGRTTQKSRISTGARNSYEWLLYHHLRRHYATNNRVRFSIADGPLLYVDVGGFVLRTTHGDDFRFAGGVGGVLIPLRKAVTAWNTHRHADATLMGHWHDYQPGPREIVNGSLIGVSPYGLARVRAPHQVPMQAFFLIHHERRAITAQSPIWVDR